MSDNGKEAEKQIENEIPICADDWLAVFRLLSPRQLGLEIALLSQRFDRFVDEHFKTRKWSLGTIVINQKIGENGTAEMEIANFRRQSLPIPQNPLPNKVIGFKFLRIEYIDQNVMAFLCHFQRIFGTNLSIDTKNGQISDFTIHNAWPMIKDNVCTVRWISEKYTKYLGQFVPSDLNECKSLRYLFSESNFIKLPVHHGTGTLSIGQAVAKWLFTPRPDGVPKLFNCYCPNGWQQIETQIQRAKEAFSNASSPANFIIAVCCNRHLKVPFNLTNPKTEERFFTKLSVQGYRYGRHGFLLVRCPIARDEQKWAKWENEARNLQSRRNEISIWLNE